LLPVLSAERNVEVPLAVLICVFAMVTSFADTAGKTGRADRNIVLNRGADSEGAGNFPRESAGGLFPAIRAARLSVAAAMRG
jgi:hypothetical protein